MNAAYSAFMINKNAKTFILALASAGLLSGCAMIEGAGTDLRNWGNYIDRKLNQEQTNEQASSNLQSLAMLDGNCPPIEQLPQLSVFHEFTDPTNPSADNKMATVNIVNIAGRCNKEGDFLSVTLDITFNSMLGPKGRSRPSDRPFFSFPYFISVMDNQNTVLAKEVFAVSTSFEQGEEAISTIETIKQNLPLNSDGSVPAYIMQVGFELSEEQLRYNTGL